MSNRLSDISPDDVERIEVLRGAAAAALYGSRAKNGVIQVITKRGIQGATRVTWGTQLEVSSAADVEPAFKAIARERINGLVVLQDAALYSLRHDIGARAAALKLPSIWGQRGYLDAGGVASYQGDMRALFTRSAVLIDKVLKGTPPGEIPFEQGTKFELVINLINCVSIVLVTRDFTAVAWPLFVTTGPWPPSIPDG